MTRREKKQAQAAPQTSPEEPPEETLDRLADEEAVPESIVQTVREPFLVLDNKLRVLSANASFFKAFRTTPEDAYGRRVYELGNRQWDIPQLRTLLEEILPEHSRFTDYEVEHDFPGIGRRTMILNARKLREPKQRILVVEEEEKGEGEGEENEEDEMILLAIEDVTERREYEALRENARRREREETRLFIESVREYAIFVLDPFGHVASWNAGAQRIEGYRADEIIGEHVSRFYTEADRARSRPQKDLRLAEARGEYQEEVWRVKKDGSRFWANVVITALVDEGGPLRGFTIVTRDLTERKRDADAIEAHVEDLAARNRMLRLTNESLDAFTYVVGHDLKEPTRAMESLFSIIEEDHKADLPPDLQALLTKAREANRRLAALITGLLAFGRAARADMSELTPIALDDALRSDDCTTRFRDRLAERGARLEYPGHDVVVHANPPALCQILGNLIENAIKHNPNPNPFVRVRAQWASEEGMVDVIVEDNGPGFPLDVIAGLERMTTATRGFGLVIAKRSAELHGGRLRLDRSPEGGGAVHVTLPAPPQQPE